ncbi:hypothetical protein ACFQ1L_15780 [Phytohabitans flavus]|uniref:hypothetical protein n=1 Tax=Phytohabitans flavus TaxID=1076124 RepID=UPI003641A088
MRPQDYEGGPSQAEIEAFQRALAEWEARRDDLATQHAAASANLVAAQSQVATLAEWVRRLEVVVNGVAPRAQAYSSVRYSMDATSAQIDEATGLLADYTESRATAAARLIGGHRSATPLVLLPLRLETKWAGGTLHVRIYPDALSVDAHDPTLTADESTWGAHYWAVRAGTLTADADQTWEQLVGRFGPQRAAWIVQAAKPGRPSPGRGPTPGRLRPGPSCCRTGSRSSPCPGGSRSTSPRRRAGAIRHMDRERHRRSRVRRLRPVGARVGMAWRPQRRPRRRPGGQPRGAARRPADRAARRRGCPDRRRRRAARRAAARPGVQCRGRGAGRRHTDEQQRRRAGRLQPGTAAADRGGTA